MPTCQRIGAIVVKRSAAFYAPKGNADLQHLFNLSLFIPTRIVGKRRFAAMPTYTLSPFNWFCRMTALGASSGLRPRGVQGVYQIGLE